MAISLGVYPIFRPSRIWWSSWPSWLMPPSWPSWPSRSMENSKSSSHRGAGLVFFGGSDGSPMKSQGIPMKSHFFGGSHPNWWKSHEEIPRNSAELGLRCRGWDQFHRFQGGAGIYIKTPCPPQVQVRKRSKKGGIFRKIAEMRDL